MIIIGFSNSMLLAYRNNIDIPDFRAPSRIEYSINISKPFKHPDYPFYKRNKSNISAVIMTGSDGSASHLDTRKYMTLSKMYYAKRHGYDFAYITSDEVLDYFPLDMMTVSLSYLCPLSTPCNELYRLTLTLISF